MHQYVPYLKFQNNEVYIEYHLTFRSEEVTLSGHGHRHTHTQRWRRHNNFYHLQQLRKFSCFLILIYRGTIKFTMTSNISEVWKHHRGSVISWAFQWWKSCRPADVVMQEKARRTIKLYSLPTARPLIHYVMLSNERLHASLIRFIYTCLSDTVKCVCGSFIKMPRIRDGWRPDDTHTHTKDSQCCVLRTLHGKSLQFCIQV